MWEKSAPTGATTPEELEEDISDDGIAAIGGGEWTFGLWDGVLENVYTLTIHDGTFDGSMNLRDAEFIINGGTINIGFFWCSASNVTINGGTFTDP